MDKKNTLCWYCERAINESLPCPWIDDGIPVPEWKVTDEHAISGKIRTGDHETCTVVECPLYKQCTNALTLSEYINETIKDTGMLYCTAHSNPRSALKKYIKKTGKIPPRWVIEELLFHEEQKR